MVFVVNERATTKIYTYSHTRCHPGALPIFAEFLEPRAARKRRKRIDLGGLLADDAVEFDDERALADRKAGVGTTREQNEQRDEEEKQEDEREGILDHDEQETGSASWRERSSQNVDISGVGG